MSIEQEILNQALTSAGAGLLPPPDQDEVGLVVYEAQRYGAATKNLILYGEGVTRAVILALYAMEREKYFTYLGYKDLRSWMDVELKDIQMERDYLSRWVHVVANTLIPADDAGMDVGKLVEDCNLRSLKESPAIMTLLPTVESRQEYMDALASGKPYVQVRADGDRLLERERPDKKAPAILTASLQLDGTYVVSGTWTQDDMLYVRMVAPRLEIQLDTGEVIHVEQ